MSTGGGLTVRVGVSWMRKDVKSVRVFVIWVIWNSTRYVPDQLINIICGICLVARSAPERLGPFREPSREARIDGVENIPPERVWDGGLLTIGSNDCECLFRNNLRGRDRVRSPVPVRGS